MTESPVSIDTQHDDMIHDAQLDYYSRKLATASSDRSIKVWDIDGQRQQLSATLSGHDGPVWEVAWAHPRYGVLLASCSFDSAVMVHRESPPGTWTQVYVFRGHTASVNSISWAPHEHGLILACASSDGKVSIHEHQEDDTWTVSTISDSSLGCLSVSWAPYAHGSAADGQAPPKRLVTGSCENMVRVWQYAPAEASWKQERLVQEQALVHKDWVRDVAWAPFSGMPVNTIASCSEDRSVLIWTQDEAGEGAWTPTLLHTFDSPVWRVSWSTTGNVLAVSSGDSKVTLWKQEVDASWKQVSVE